MSMLAAPFQLLEINLISAQDLAPVSKSIKAYAVAWLNPERKLTTQIDPNGQTNPTWNEKFVFRVDDEFLSSEDSAIMIEIYASAWLRDVLIGTVGVLVSNLLPPSARSSCNRKSKLRFVGLQVRRPSGRPQGILNIGVNLVDATIRSMPMYSELSASAVGYWDLMDAKKHKSNQKPNQQFTNTAKQLENHDQNHVNPPPIDSKMMITLQRSQSEKNESTINDYTYIPPAGKPGSMCNGYVFDGHGGSEIGVGVQQPQKGRIVNANGSLCSDVGPSPSVVAAAIAKGLYPVPLPAPPRMPVGAAYEGWSEKDSAEGLKTKIERCRTELPPIYDHLGQKQKKVKQTPKGSGAQTQRRPGRGNGLFSCFGTAYGCEFSISCGGGNREKRYDSGKPRLTPSEITYDESYI